MSFGPPHSWLGSQGSSSRYYQEGLYEDMLEPRRQNGELCWALHRFKHPTTAQWRFHGSQGKGDTSDELNARESPSPKSTENHTPKAIIESVLASPRVKYGIQVIVDESGLSEMSVLAEAKEILQEMAHNMDYLSMRLAAIAVTKSFKRLYRRIFVNRDGVEQLRQAMLNYPVVLLPTHRSYADFLLMSYVCMEYDIAMPVIAAAQDFLNMKFFGSVLRNCGAFFIRRSFVSDPLYWLLFTEYVQFHIRECNNPIEFFMEGKRSRTGKSLLPKVGMLGTIFQSWFTGQVPDILLVPVAISYDRILEESLHAYELIGQPKPKESASGLLKARSILNEDFGQVYIHICPPISLRSLSKDSISRFKHSLQSRLMSHQLFPEEIHHVKHLSRLVIAQHQNALCIGPVHVMICCLLTHSQRMSSSFSSFTSSSSSSSSASFSAAHFTLSVVDLLEQAVQLNQFIHNLGAHVNWPVGLDKQDSWQRLLSVHNALLHVCAESNPTEAAVYPQFVHSLLHFPSDNIVGSGSHNDSAIIGIVANYFQLTLYRNHALHSLLREVILLIALHCQAPRPVSLLHLRHEMDFWLTLFWQEFIFEAYTLDKNFNTALKNLVSIGLVDKCPKSDSYTLSLSTEMLPLRHVLLEIIQPYVFAYYVTVATLQQQSSGSQQQQHPLDVTRDVKSLTKSIQELGMQLLRQQIHSSSSASPSRSHCWRLGFQYLCIDTIDNAIVGSHKLCGPHFHSVRRYSLDEIVNKLSFCLPQCPAAKQIQNEFTTLLTRRHNCVKVAPSDQPISRL